MSISSQTPSNLGRFAILPNETISYVMGKLPDSALFSLRQTSKQFQVFADDEKMLNTDHRFKDKIFSVIKVTQNKLLKKELSKQGANLYKKHVLNYFQFWYDCKAFCEIAIPFPGSSKKGELLHVIFYVGERNISNYEIENEGVVLSTLTSDQRMYNSLEEVMFSSITNNSHLYNTYCNTRSLVSGIKKSNRSLENCCLFFGREQLSPKLMSLISNIAFQKNRPIYHTDRPLRVSQIYKEDPFATPSSRCTIM